MDCIHILISYKGPVSSENSNGTRQKLIPMRLKYERNLSNILYYIKKNGFNMDAKIPYINF